MSEKTEVILITETVAQSWARDASTWALVAVTILPGWWIGSGWLSALGFIMFWLALFSRMSQAYQKAKMTIAQARAKLDEIEALE